MDIHTDQSQQKAISRKEALNKAGRFALFTAAVSLAILTPRKAVAQSTTGLINPGWGTGGGSAPPGGGTGSQSNSLYTRPEPARTKSGMKDSPWK